MKIRKIRLVNFKNFEDTEVQLGDLNVFVGANASGKSNIVEALRFLRYVAEEGVDNAISRMGGVEYLRNIKIGGDKPTEIHLEFDRSEKLSFYIPYLHIGENHFETSIYPSKYILQIGYSEKTYRISEHFFVDLNIAQTEEPKTLPPEEEYGYENTVYGCNPKALGNFELEWTTENDGRLKLKQSSLDLTLKGGEKIEVEVEVLLGDYWFDLDEPKNQGISVLAIFEQNYYFTFSKDFKLYDFDVKKAKLPVRYGRVELEENGENLTLALKKVLEDKKSASAFMNLVKDVLGFVTHLEINRSPFDNAVEFHINEEFNNGNKIPSFLLSDGTISTIATILALYFDNMRLNVFEEPERGIHPSLISNLMSLFYAILYEKQVIITTHSPEILKHTELEDIILVSRDEKGFSKLSKPKDQEMVNAFLKNDLGIDSLFVQNLLDH